MSYHLKSSLKGNKKTGKFLLVGFFFFILFIFILNFSSVSGVIFKIGQPFWTLSNNFKNSFSNSFSILNSKSGLIKNNNDLKNEVKRLTSDKTLIDLLKKENEDLKYLLGRKSINSKTVLATILVKPTLSPYDTFIVDVGEDQGISVGDRVVADANVFMGFVSEVYKNTSKIILYSSPNEKVIVLIGDNNIEKEALGVGGGNFRIETPREIDIKEGDKITIPSISPNIFGIVEKVEYKDADSFQTVLFKNPINIQELKWVEIIQSKK